MLVPHERALDLTTPPAPCPERGERDGLAPFAPAGDRRPGAPPLPASARLLRGPRAAGRHGHDQAMKRPTPAMRGAHGDAALHRGLHAPASHGRPSGRLPSTSTHASACSKPAVPRPAMIARRERIPVSSFGVSPRSFTAAVAAAWGCGVAAGGGQRGRWSLGRISLRTGGRVAERGAEPDAAAAAVAVLELALRVVQLTAAAG